MIGIPNLSGDHRPMTAVVDSAGPWRVELTAGDVELVGSGGLLSGRDGGNVRDGTRRPGFAGIPWWSGAVDGLATH